MRSLYENTVDFQTFAAISAVIPKSLSFAHFPNAVFLTFYSLNYCYFVNQPIAMRKFQTSDFINLGIFLLLHLHPNLRPIPKPEHQPLICIHRHTLYRGIPAGIRELNLQQIQFLQRKQAAIFLHFVRDQDGGVQLVSVQDYFAKLHSQY